MPSAPPQRATGRAGGPKDGLRQQGSASRDSYSTGLSLHSALRLAPDRSGQAVASTPFDSVGRVPSLRAGSILLRRIEVGFLFEKLKQPNTPTLVAPKAGATRMGHPDLFENLKHPL